MTGDGALTVAVPLLAASLTTDPLTLSVVSAAALLPWLLVGLHAGALTDRWPRRRTMILADLGRAAVLGVLTLLLITDHATIAVLATAVALIGVGQCFFDTAAQGMIPAIVGRGKDDLTWINGKFWALDTVGRGLAGPSLGAAAFAASRTIPFAVDAASFLVSAGLVRRLPEVPPEQRTTRTTVTADVREGVRFVLRHRRLRTLAAVMFANNAAFSIASATFVLFAGQVLHIPPAAYGLLFAAAAAGGILTGWWARPLTRRLSHHAALTIALTAQALAWAAIATTENVWVTGITLAICDAAVTIGTIAIVSARQESTPDALLGRVTAMFRLAGAGIPVAAALAGGWLAAQFGLHTPLIAAAAMLAVTALATAARPAAFRADRP